MTAVVYDIWYTVKDSSFPSRKWYKRYYYQAEKDFKLEFVIQWIFRWKKFIDATT